MKRLLVLLFILAPLGNLAHAQRVIVNPVAVQTPQGPALMLQICKNDGSCVNGPTYLTSDLERQGRALRGQQGHEARVGQARDAVVIAGGIVVAGAALLAIGWLGVFFALGASLTTPMGAGTIAFINGVQAVTGILTSISGIIVTAAGVIFASLGGAKYLNNAEALGRQATVIEMSLNKQSNAAVTMTELESALVGIQPVYNPEEGGGIYYP